MTIFKLFFGFINILFPVIHIQYKRLLLPRISNKLCNNIKMYLKNIECICFREIAEFILRTAEKFCSSQYKFVWTIYGDTEIVSAKYHFTGHVIGESRFVNGTLTCPARIYRMHNSGWRLWYLRCLTRLFATIPSQPSSAVHSWRLRSWYNSPPRQCCA